MDDLVGDLQRQIQEILLPVSQRNDMHTAYQASLRQQIVNTWYRWAQEIFCDAVGFEIDGPCFVNALAEYIAELHSTDFHRSEDHLRGSTHPIMALRIELLISRARARGYDHSGASWS
jgi:hypothetical protein